MRLSCVFQGGPAIHTARAALLVTAAHLLTVGVLSAQQVPYERLKRAAEEPHNWLTYSGTYASERFLPLTEITPSNVADLKVVWVYQTSPGLVETTPLVVDDVMFLTEPPSTVTALDVRTGRRIWRWIPAMPAEVKHIGFPAVNRGVGILDETVHADSHDQGYSRVVPAGGGLDDGYRFGRKDHAIVD